MKFLVYRDFNGSGYSQLHIKNANAGETVRFTACKKNGQTDVNVGSDSFYNLTVTSTTGTALFFPFNNQLGAGDTTTHSFFPFLMKLVYNTANPGHIEYYDADGVFHKLMLYDIGNSEATATELSVFEESGGGSVSVTINDGGNLAKVTYGETDYTTFPLSLTVENGDEIEASGKDDPVITINYTNTDEPVIS